MSDLTEKKDLGSLRWLWLTVVVLAIDLLTKTWADTQLEYGMPNRITAWFDLTLLYNKGAAFSFLAQASGWQRWFFIGIACVISTILIVWLKRTDRRQWWLGLGLALILGGALGNLHDRILLGHVVDFISVHYMDYYFPAFNLADSAITLGATIMIIDMLFLEQKLDIENLHGKEDRRHS